MTIRTFSLSAAARERWAAIGLVTLVALLAYGLLLPWLGFYRDDWYQIWAGTTLGPRSIITLFSIDRPVMGYTYAAAFFLFRDSALAWQLYALALRWLGALGALWLFRKLWPRQPVLTTSAALLFLVYPGFLQQPNGDTFSNQLAGYAAEVLSLAATAELLDSPPGRRRTALTIFAVISGFGCWLLYEYMIGLETLRIILLVRDARKATGRLSRRSFSRFLASSAPFLVPLLAFLAWRLFIFRAGRGSVDVAQVFGPYGAAPGPALFDRAAELIRDFFEASLFGWFVPAYDRISAVGAGTFVLALIPSLLAIFAFLRFARSAAAGDARPVSAATASGGPGSELILLGSLTTLGSLTPVVLAGRDIRWTSAFDRYTLHTTLGLAMLTVGLIESTVQARTRLAVIAFLLGLSVLAHQANAVLWARFWQEQRQLWWQLSWRAPGLQSGTVLMVDLPSQRYFEDYEVWGPANLIYAPGDREPDIAAEVIAEDTVRKVWSGTRETRYMRVLIGIPRDFSKTLVVDWPSRESCVHVLEAEQPETAVTSDSLVRSIADFSRGDLIRTHGDAAKPPARIFGTEPIRGWCWYYQAVALARQDGDWPRAVELAEQARKLGLAPSDSSEWMPFFQAYLNTGNLEEGKRLAELIRADDPAARQICSRLAERHFLNQDIYLRARQMLCGQASPDAEGPAPVPLS